jgi:hypothetical protein
MMGSEYKREREREREFRAAFCRLKCYNKYYKASIYRDAMSDEQVNHIRN